MKFFTYYVYTKIYRNVLLGVNAAVGKSNTQRFLSKITVFVLLLVSFLLLNFVCELTVMSECETCIVIKINTVIVFIAVSVGFVTIPAVSTISQSYQRLQP